MALDKELEHPLLWTGERWEGAFRKDGKENPHGGGYHHDGPFVLLTDYNKLLEKYHQLEEAYLRLNPPIIYKARPIRGERAIPGVDCICHPEAHIHPNPMCPTHGHWTGGAHATEERIVPEDGQQQHQDGDQSGAPTEAGGSYRFVESREVEQKEVVHPFGDSGMTISELDRILKPAVPKPEELFYIATTNHEALWPRGVILWWGPDSNGYATMLEHAGKYSRERAEAICTRDKYQSNFMVPVSEVDPLGITVVDYDLLHKFKEIDKLCR